MPETTKNERSFAIQRLYTKDVSFESPHSPQIFLEDTQPEIQVNLNNTANPMDENHHEAVLTLQVEGRHQEKTLFLIEVHQAGIFLVSGFQKEEMPPLFNIGIPNILFPYARETVSDLAMRGGLPQLILQPINFEAMYAQKMASAGQSTTTES